MRIGIDVRTVQAQRAGIGIYTEHLVRALQEVRQDEAFVLFGSPDTAWDRLPAGTGFEHRRIPHGGLRWHLEAAKRTHDVTVYHSPSSLLVPLMIPAKAVVTIHDLVPFLMPEVSNFKTWWTHRLLRHTIQRVRRIIAVSANTAQDLSRVIPDLRVPVVTIHEGPRPWFTPASKPRFEGTGTDPSDYFLAVGTLEPRKNLALLLRAYQRATEIDPSLPPLIVAGKLGWKNHAFESLLSDPALASRVHLAGYVTDERLLELFRGARAFVYPSLYEGFGLPVVEAMACGTPVITSAVSSLPEVGGDAALYVDPHDETGLSERLLAMRDDHLRDDLRERGLRQAASFSWERAARETLAVYWGKAEP